MRQVVGQWGRGVISDFKDNAQARRRKELSKRQKERDAEAPRSLVSVLLKLSVEAEVDLYVDVDRNGGFAVFHGGLELVLADGFHSLFVEAHAEGADDMDILRISLRVNNESDEADALVLGAAGFIREFRFRLEERNGC